MGIKDLAKTALNYLKPVSDEAFLRHEHAKKSLLSPSNHGAGDVYFWNGGTEHHFSWTSAKSSLKAYQQCPPVAAIINRKAQAYINGKTWVLNTKGKEVDSPDARKIKARLARPNPMQTGKQFEGQGYIFQQLYGYNVVLSVKPLGFKDNKDASSLWNITPFCEINLRRGANLYGITNAKDLIHSVVFCYDGERRELPLDDIFIFKDIIPSFDTIVLPQSRLSSLELPINNIIGAFESRNVLINSRGPMYVVSSNESDASGNIALNPKEKDDLQKEFKHRYGLTKKQSTAIITNSNIRVSTVGFPTRELMLLEEVQESCKSICDGLNFPPHLLGLIDPTFNNQNAAEKGLYQNAIMPDSMNTYEQWNDFFGITDTNLTLDKDYSHIAVLQEDRQLAAAARKTRNDALQVEFARDLLTVNRWLQLNDEDPIEGGDVYWSEWKKTRGIAELPTQQNNQDGQQQNTAGTEAGNR